MPQSYEDLVQSADMIITGDLDSYKALETLKDKQPGRFKAIVQIKSESLKKLRSMCKNIFSNSRSGSNKGSSYEDSEEGNEEIPDEFEEFESEPEKEETVQEEEKTQEPKEIIQLKLETEPQLSFETISKRAK